MQKSWILCQLKAQSYTLIVMHILLPWLQVSSFHHPIGWLLANGTIPRIGSVFESVSRFFDNSCLPGKFGDMYSAVHDSIKIMVWTNFKKREKLMFRQ